jgi:uncharacterized protein (DUF2141 family)
VKPTLRAVTLSAVLFVASLSTADTPPTAVLSMRVSQLRSNDGQVGTVVSNHAKGFMGPPTFDKAKFSFSGSATALDLRMGY